MQHAAAAWHIEHAPIVILESDRCTVSDDTDDLEHHAAIAHKRFPDRFGSGRHVVLREDFVHDNRSRRPRTVPVCELSPSQNGHTIVLK